MLTRKQRWRKVLSKRPQINTINNCFDIEDHDDIENIEDNIFRIVEIHEMIKKDVNFDINKPNLKKVRFSNIVHATLIPTKEEINSVMQIYYVNTPLSENNSFIIDKLFKK